MGRALVTPCPVRVGWELATWARRGSGFQEWPTQPTFSNLKPVDPCDLECFFLDWESFLGSWNLKLESILKGSFAESASKSSYWKVSACVTLMAGCSQPPETMHLWCGLGC